MVTRHAQVFSILASFVVGSHALAAGGLDATGLGLSLSPEYGPGQALQVYADKHGKRHTVNYRTIDITSIQLERDNATQINLRFNIRNRNIRSPDVDGAVLFCDGSLVRERDSWKFDGGCEI